MQCAVDGQHPLEHGKETVQGDGLTRRQCGMHCGARRILREVSWWCATVDGGNGVEELRTERKQVRFVEGCDVLPVPERMSEML